MNKTKGQDITKRYSAKEEKYNTITHALGIVFGLVAGTVIVRNAALSGNPWGVGSIIVYALFMTFSYVTSTLYHYNKNEKTKTLLRKFDHAAIYLSIAGSYTPFTLVVLRNQGYWGWTLFAVIWFAAIAGVFLSFYNLKNASKLELACYIAMGWVVVIALKPLIDSLSATNSMNVFWWLIGGGMAYTLGAVLYSFKKIPYMHAIWHLFVLAGSVCHVMAIGQIKL
ncbi:MAG: channel protein, hemolysin family [Bacteroidetes bacterium]|jgi:hemolysin III|nr:channel protein, hemolysin family [Bacteroidota bacterium]